MKVMLSQGDVLEVEFEEAEQVFEIAHKEDNLVTITQISGFEIYRVDDSDYKEIYREEAA